MTTWFIISLILFGTFKIVLTCQPTFVAKWFTKKMELHQKLSNDTVNITMNGERLEGEDKIQVINHFNQAIFLKRYLEQFYTPPKTSGTPLVIDTKRGKKNIRLVVYRYNDHVDVVKQYKKKVVAAYSLRSDGLQIA